MDLNKEDEYIINIQKAESNKIKFEVNPDKTSKKNEPASNNIIENIKTAENSNQLSNQFKKKVENIENYNLIKPKKLIFGTKKVPKRFLSYKLGRPKKSRSKTRDLRKGRFRKVNVTPKIFNGCKTNMHNFILVHAKGIDLQEPDINEGGKNNHTYWKQVSNKTLYEIYCNTIPKRFLGDTQIEEKKGEIRAQKRREMYSKINKNKKEIDAILREEKYEIIFKGLLFKDFLIPYLNNKTRIIKTHEKYGLIEIDLKGFETYSQFNNYDYNQTQKEEFKNHVLDIINGNAKNRKRTKK